MKARGVDLWSAAVVQEGWVGAPTLPRAISFLLRLQPATLEGLGQGPTPADLAEYRRVNEELVVIGEALVGLLQSGGWRAERVDDDAPDGPGDPPIFASKTAATQAGLGWIGKTALLVTPGYGSAVRMGTVFTDLPLPAGTPVDRSRCGACRSCVEACPAGAGRDVSWRPGMPRDLLYDCVACEAYQRGFPEFDETCGICIWVCPYTRRAFRSRSGAPPRATGQITERGDTR
jgi:epoxyqueuosine reductase